MGKKEKGRNNLFSYMLRLLGRISSGEVDGNLGEENQDLKKGVGKNIKLWGPLKALHLGDGL